MCFPRSVSLRGFCFLFFPKQKPKEEKQRQKQSNETTKETASRLILTVSFPKPFFFLPFFCALPLSLRVLRGCVVRFRVGDGKKRGPRVKENLAKTKNTEERPTGNTPSDFSQKGRIAHSFARAGRRKTEGNPRGGDDGSKKANPNTKKQSKRKSGTTQEKQTARRNKSQSRWSC